MFTGCGTALVTPFRQDMSLDEAAVRRLAKRQVEAGIDFLVPCGTTGENPTLTREEHLRVVAIAVEEARTAKTPVLAGAGGYNTQEVVELARECERAGANGILSVTPYYNKPTPEGLYQHYKAIAAKTSLPIVVYNVPGRTGLNVEPATLKRLSEIDSVVGVKEASGNIGQMASIIAQLPPTFKVLAGDDSISLPLIALGGQGLISVVSNEIPGDIARMVHFCMGDDFSAARELYYRYLPLMEVNFCESNPIPVKAAMALMGLIEPVWRLPMVAPKPESMARIEKVLRDLDMAGSGSVSRPAAG